MYNDINSDDEEVDVYDYNNDDDDDDDIVMMLLRMNFQIKKIIDDVDDHEVDNNDEHEGHDGFPYDRKSMIIVMIMIIKLKIMMLMMFMIRVMTNRLSPTAKIVL